MLTKRLVQVHSVLAVRSRRVGMSLPVWYIFQMMQGEVSSFVPLNNWLAL